MRGNSKVKRQNSKVKKGVSRKMPDLNDHQHADGRNWEIEKGDGDLPAIKPSCR